MKVADLTTSTGNFRKNLGQMCLRAKAGDRIIVEDGDGTRYSFQVELSISPTFETVANDIAGSYRSGEKALASDPKHMSGYGQRLPAKQLRKSKKPPGK